MVIKMLVACFDDVSDAPSFFPCKIECTVRQYKQAKAYWASEDVASDNGYAGPMVSFDENDDVGKVFGCVDWDSAKTTDIRKVAVYAPRRSQ